MADVRAPLVFIMEKTACELAYNSECYDLEDLGGTTPSVGDEIVSPPAPTGGDPRNPVNRKIRRVMHRYIVPAREGIGARIYLVVETRTGRLEENGVLYNA